MKVSVCIPVYNGEESIQKAIESVLNQSYQDFEIVIINDGSCDKTEEVVLSIQSDKIHYFKKKNEGIASGRNSAVDHAQGEYIAFLDSDDTMEENALEMLVAKAEETGAEMVVGDYRYVYSDGKTQEMKSASFPLTNWKKNPELLYEIMPQFWNKLIKKEIFSRMDIRFPLGLVFEDLCCFACMLPWVNSVAKCDTILVNYVQTETSIMAGARQIKPTIYDFRKVIQIIDGYYKAHHYGNQKELETLFTLNARELVDSLFKNHQASLEEKEVVIQDVLSYLNENYPQWPANTVYRNKYKSFGNVYCLKRRVIDSLLAKGKVEFVLTKILKEG